jgi:hypothetical protein
MEAERAKPGPATKPGLSTRSRTAVPLAVAEEVLVADIPLPDDGDWLADKTVDVLDSTNVDKLLASSIKPSTAAKYAKIWDRWAVFASFHEVEIMPPTSGPWRSLLPIWPSSRGHQE